MCGVMFSDANCFGFLVCSFFFFFNDTATTEIYTLSLHDALPIWKPRGHPQHQPGGGHALRAPVEPDRKSTRLNSSHSQISYAVFCLKKKKNTSVYLFQYTFKPHCPCAPQPLCRSTSICNYDSRRD